VCAACGRVWSGFGGVSVCVYGVRVVCCVWESLERVWESECVCACMWCVCVVWVWVCVLGLCVLRVGQFGVGFGGVSACVCACVCGCVWFFGVCLCRVCMCCV